MYKQFALTFCLSLILNQLYSQGKRDAIWMLGGQSNGEGIQMDFNTDPVDVSLIKRDMQFIGANVSLCDTTGQLLFYTNACYLANANHELMENGDTLSPGRIQGSYCDINGAPINQSVIALPAPEAPTDYYLIHYFVETVRFDYSNSWPLPTELLYTKIDMTHNGGLGAVTEKRQLIWRDTFVWGYLQAVKHANGRDWWIIAPKFSSNCYFSTLLGPDGFDGPYQQCIDNAWSRMDWSGQAVFSPDGSKYIRFNPWNGLNIFDFDRCTGLLANHRAISFPNDTIDLSGVAVSPNSRYLYATTAWKVYQFDLWADDIANSKQLIAEYDGFSNPFPTVFNLAQLGPDGKIYIASSSSTYNLHVINQPDSAGLACDLVQHGIDLPGPNFWTIPNLSHYRTEALDEACDIAPMTVEVDIRNPQCYGDADGELSIQASGGSGPLSFSFSDPSAIVDGWQVKGLKAGIYGLSITDGSGLSLVRKILIEQPEQMTVTSEIIPVSCKGDADGAIDLSMSGGTPPYGYFWNNGMGGSSIGNLAAGPYTATISDINTCLFYHHDTVAESEELLTLSFTVWDESENMGDGWIRAVLLGGTRPYNYLWNTVPPQSGRRAVNLTAGTYTVTVSDAYGCVLVDSATVSLVSPLNEIEKEYSVKLYPNPVENDVIYVDLPDLYSGYWQIRDLAGRLVQSGKFQQLKRFSIHTDLDNGLYLLHIQTADGHYHWNEKVMINH